MDRHLDLADRLLAEADAAHALAPASFTSSLGIKMLWCPPGLFLMGGPQDEEGHVDRENQVQVGISQGFGLASTPMSQGQWLAMIRNSPSHFGGSKDLPVEAGSWEDAQGFCAKLNLGPSDHPGYRDALPGEAQWEYACRAGEKGPCSGGALDDLGWYEATLKG